MIGICCIMIPMNPYRDTSLDRLPPLSNMKGRPTVYDHKLAQEICEQLACGFTLRAVCRNNEHFPPPETITRWAVNNVNGFSVHYELAREIGFQAMADELLEIADDSTNDFIDQIGKTGKMQRVVDHEHVNRSRLRIDARKWLLAKGLPRRFGDSLHVQVEHKIDLNAAIDDARERVKVIEHSSKNTSKNEPGSEWYTSMKSMGYA